MTSTIPNSNPAEKVEFQIKFHTPEQFDAIFNNLVLVIKSGAVAYHYRLEAAAQRDLWASISKPNHYGPDLA